MDVDRIEIQEQQHVAKSKYASAVHSLAALPPTNLIRSVSSSRDPKDIPPPSTLSRGVSLGTAKNQISNESRQLPNGLLALNAFKASLHNPSKSSDTTTPLLQETEEDADASSALLKPTVLKRGASLGSAKERRPAYVSLEEDGIISKGLVKSESFRERISKAGQNVLVKAESFRARISKPGHDMLLDRSLTYGLTKEQISGISDWCQKEEKKEALEEPKDFFFEGGNREEADSQDGSPTTTSTPLGEEGDAKERASRGRHHKPAEERGVDMEDSRHRKTSSVSPSNRSECEEDAIKKRVSRGTHRGRHDKADKSPKNSPSVSSSKRSEDDDDVVHKRVSRGTHRGRQDKAIRGRGVGMEESSHRKSPSVSPSNRSEDEEDVIKKRVSRGTHRGRHDKPDKSPKNSPSVSPSKPSEDEEEVVHKRVSRGTHRGRHHHGKAATGSGACMDGSSRNKSPCVSSSKPEQGNEEDVPKKRISRGINSSHHQPSATTSRARSKSPKRREATESSCPPTVVKKESSGSLKSSPPRSRSRSPHREAAKEDTHVADGEEAEILKKRISRGRGKESREHKTSRPGKCDEPLSSLHGERVKKVPSSRSKKSPTSTSSRKASQDAAGDEKRVSRTVRSGHEPVAQEGSPPDEYRTSKESRRRDAHQRSPTSPRRVKSAPDEVTGILADGNDNVDDGEKEARARVKDERRRRCKHPERHTHTRRVRKTKSGEDIVHNQLAQAIASTDDEAGFECEHNLSDTDVHSCSDDEDEEAMQAAQKGKTTGVAMLKSLASTTINAGITVASTTANVTAVASTAAVKTTLSTVKTTLNVGTTTAWTSMQAFSTLSSAATFAATSALHQGQGMIYGDSAKKMMTEGAAPSQNLTQFVEEAEPGTIGNVTSTWKKIKEIRNFDEKAGILLFTNLFELCPAAKGIFGLPANGDPKSDELRNSPVFKQHSVLLIHMIDKALNLLTYHEAEPAKLQKILFDLGKKHSRLGIERDYFPFMGAALMETLRKMLGKSSFTPNIEKSWVLVYNILASEMCHGIASDGIVLETWGKVKSMPLYKEKVGLLLFKHLFEQCPESKKLFGLPLDFSTDIKDMKASAKCRMHTEVFIMMFDKALNMVEAKALDKKLEELAAKHVKLGVKIEYFPVMGEGLFHALEVQLKNDFTDDVRDAWLSSYSRMSSRIVAVMRSMEKK